MTPCQQCILHVLCGVCCTRSMIRRDSCPFWFSYILILDAKWLSMCAFCFLFFLSLPRLYSFCWRRAQDCRPSNICSRFFNYIPTMVLYGLISVILSHMIVIRVRYTNSYSFCWRRAQGCRPSNICSRFFNYIPTMVYMGLSLLFCRIRL